MICGGLGTGPGFIVGFFAQAVAFNYAYNNLPGWQNVIAFVVGTIVTAALFYIYCLTKARRSYSIDSWCRSNGWDYQGSGDPFGSGIIKHPEDLEDSRLYWSGEIPFVRSQNSMAKKFGDRGVVVLERFDSETELMFLVMDYGELLRR